MRLQNDFQYYAFNHYSHRSTAYRRAFWHDIGFSYTQSILLMCLPLGIGLFLMQVFTTKDVIRTGKCHLTLN